MGLASSGVIVRQRSGSRCWLPLEKAPCANPSPATLATNQPRILRVVAAEISRHAQRRQQVDKRVDQVLASDAKRHLQNNALARVLIHDR